MTAVDDDSTERLAGDTACQRTATLRFTDLPVWDALWEGAFPVLQELRPELTRDTFEEIYACAFREGLRYTAAIEDEQVVGLAGWRVMTTAYAHRKLHVDDLAVLERDRSRGVGSHLIAHLVARAEELACTAVDLDSRVHRHSAHRFYLRERFDISAHHFQLTLPVADSTACPRPPRP